MASLSGYEIISAVILSLLHTQLSFKENAVRQHEATISSLEEDQVKMSRHYEERQLQWEQREMEMERIINKLENQQQEIAGAASKVRPRYLHRASWVLLIRLKF